MNLFLCFKKEALVMDYIKFIIIAGIIIWVIQGVFGLFQVRNFNSNFVEMRKKGKVATGFNRGRFFSGTIVLIRIDDDANIEEVRCMQGVTVLAKFKELKGLENKNLLSLQEEDLKNFNKLIRKAVHKAVERYEKFMGGGEEREVVPTKKQRIEQHA